MASECKKRGSEFEFSDDFLCKKSKSPTDDEINGGGEDIFEWLSEIDEEAVGELMSLLEKEMMMSSSEDFTAAKVNFVEDPYISRSVFQCSSSYVTINGNEESCGSSFSYSDSSVMASLYVGGQGSFVCDGEWKTSLDNGEAWSEKEDVIARYLVNEAEEEVEKMCANDFDFEDVLLARFLAEDLL